ncbi:single-stranded DNA-binding protein [Janibacter sp. GXQ6167]|uniref:single-stranded DNA-binding protein n=1 Tax=Janibacter sp. GXQ6167 TaxID=3240791 RepID=UPI0035237685
MSVDVEQSETDINEVRLVGRVAAEPQTRELPSGDQLVTWRLIVRRSKRKGEERAQVDTIDIACWTPAARKRALSLQTDQRVEVTGLLHRRFFRAGGGAASRYEVEARAIRRAP